MKIVTREDLIAGRELLSYPGETLMEVLDYQGLSQKELADRMGRPEKVVSEIINGKTAITPETATALSSVLNVSASFWLSLQQNYALELAKIDALEQYYVQLDWLEHFNLKELASLGWISSKSKTLQVFNEVLALLGIANPAAFESTFMFASDARFRISLKKYTDPYALATWLSKATLTAKQQEVQQYDKRAFEQLLVSLKPIMADGSQDVTKQLEQACAAVGVRLVHLPYLKRAPVNGVARWLGDSPAIMLSSHLKTNDQYWFTFLHEAAHILKHPKTNVFLDSADDTVLDQQIKYEKEADAFAQDYLINDTAYQAFKRAHFRYNETAIIAFARQMGCHPAIVVGRLQHDKLLPYNTTFQSLKQKISYTFFQ